MTVSARQRAAAPLRAEWDFLLLWGGQTVSETGSQVTVLALPLVAIVVLKASTLQVGLLSAAVTSAYLLFALPAGVIADRAGRRRLMLGADLAQIAVIGSVPVAAAFGVLTLAQLYAAALASSAASVLFMVASTSYLPTLVGPAQLAGANARLGTTQAAAQAAGPGLGALLVGLAGAAGAMTADALSYAVSAVSLLLIRRREPHPTAGAAGRRAAARTPAREGIAYVLRDPVLRSGVAWSGTANFFVIMVEALGPVFLIREVHLRPAAVGALLALGAAGGVAGGLACGPLSRRIGSARIIWLSMTVFAPPGMLIPAAGAGWRSLLFALGWVSWSFGATLCGIALISYTQATCPAALLGRVSATRRWVAWGSLPLGGLAAGVLGARLGVHTTLWLAAAGGCLASLWLLLSPLRKMRDLPAPGVQPA